MSHYSTPFRSVYMRIDDGDCKDDGDDDDDDDDDDDRGANLAR